MYKKGITHIIMIAMLLACFPVVSANADRIQTFNGKFPGESATTSSNEEAAAAKVMAVNIDNPTALQSAISSASEPLSIDLSTDIALASALIIPAGRDITLTGDSKLIGAGGQATITVNGKLTLDGITVTHNSGSYGRGVTVNAGGVLILRSGGISGNDTTGLRNANGGSVMNINGATFTLVDGKITGNRSTLVVGGGVHNKTSSTSVSTFTMTGGEISGNTAPQRRGGYELERQNYSQRF